MAGVCVVPVDKKYELWISGEMSLRRRRIAVLWIAKACYEVDREVVKVFVGEIGLRRTCHRSGGLLLRWLLMLLLLGEHLRLKMLLLGEHL